MTSRCSPNDPQVQDVGCRMQHGDDAGGDDDAGDADDDIKWENVKIKISQNRQKVVENKKINIISEKSENLNFLINKTVWNKLKIVK